MGVNPSSLNFGAVSVNTASSPSVITLTNHGTHKLTIQQVSSNLPEFILTGPSLPLTLRNGQTASFQVVFEPDSANSFSGSLSFTTMSGPINTVLVSGAGVGPQPSPTQKYLLSTSTNSLSFGDVIVGSASGAQTVALTNSGNSSVTVSQVNTTGRASASAVFRCRSALRLGRVLRWVLDSLQRPQGA